MMQEAAMRWGQSLTDHQATGQVGRALAARWVVVLCGGGLLAAQLSCSQHCANSGPAATSHETRVIIHADDAGLCHSVNAATIRAMDEGYVNSASIMVPAPAFEEFAAYARSHPEKDFGVHLVLNAEWQAPRWGPVAGAEQVPSLVNAAGELWESPGETLIHARLRDVEIELRAQIDAARRQGIRISHLDTHMLTLFGRPDLLELYVQLGIEHGLPVALPRDAEGLRQELTPELRATHASVCEKLQAAKLPLLDVMDLGSYRVEPAGKPAYFLAALQGLRPGLSQIVVHCALDDDEMRAITPNARRREADMLFFLSTACGDALGRSGAKRVTWSDLTAASPPAL